MLRDSNVTVEDKIRKLAEETGAPSVFVSQVRSLFLTKKISLEEDCGPYISALEEAFRREAAIRRDTLITKNNLARLQKNFAEIGTKYKEQLLRLQKARNPAVPGGRRRSTDARPRESFLMVPGPKDVQ